MKLDSREKWEKVKSFLNQLKKDPQIEPFLHVEEISRFGIYDFFFINKLTSSFDFIDKNIKQGKYQILEQVLDDLRLIFSTVQDYVFEGDHLQVVCSYFIKKINLFQSNFSSSYAGTVKEKKKKTQTIKSKDQEEEKANSSGLSQKSLTQTKKQLFATLQMASYFIKNKSNLPLIKLMTSKLGLPQTTQGNSFIIDIDPKIGLQKFKSFWPSQ